MSNDDILTALSEIANEIVGTDPAEFTLEKSFADDLGVDSIEKAEIMFGVEDRFGMVISDEDSKTLATVRDAVAYIAAHAKQD